MFIYTAGLRASLLALHQFYLFFKHALADTFASMLLPLFFVIASAFSTSSTNAFSAPSVTFEQKTGISKPGRAAEKEETVLLSEEPTSQRSLSPYEAAPRIPHTIMESEKASGTWFGKRDWLTSHGVDVSVTYTADIAGNPVGGAHPGGFTYADALAYVVFFNTDKLLGWHGGCLTISALQLDGSSLSIQNIRNLFNVQETYAVETIHFVELSYEQKFCNDHVSLKGGRLLANNEFATSPLNWLYMNTGIDGNPQAIWMNGRWPSYFNAAWGSRLKIDLPGSTVARLGVYQITPSSRYGLNWNFHPNDGVMLLAQYGWNPEFFKPCETGTDFDDYNNDVDDVFSPKKITSAKPSKSAANISSSKGFVGHYWMGGYYSTWEYPQFNSVTQASNAYCLYWHMDQTVYRPKRKNEEGLILWSDYILCPQQNIALIPFQVNAGAVYTGLIPGRRNDFTIFGVVYGDLSTNYASVLQQNGLGNPTYELVYELGYRVNLTKFAYVQPDLQWVINPGGTGNTPNALVLGAQMGVVF